MVKFSNSRGRVNLRITGVRNRVWVAMHKQDSIASPASPAGGLQNDNPNAEEMERKRQNLEKVMAMAAEKGEIRNDDIQYALGISDATATRYLEELESQGNLVRLGSKKGVIYRRK